jgi:hypothetical protein
MKKLYIKCLGLLIIVSISYACNEEEFLREEPLDFLTTGNAFVTESDFESGLVDLYAKTRELYFDTNERSKAYLYGTDIFMDGRQVSTLQRFGDYNITLNPTSNVVTWHWDRLYKIVANANTLIGRAAESDLSQEAKQQIEAEARFFRAFAYRHLVNYFGGVPLLTEEVNEPKTDFSRASKDEIFNQIEEDFSFAASNLPAIEEVNDGKLSDLVAYHYLAETYISLGRFDDAINAASTVINNPNTGLMMNRFGSRSGEPGDVYWDLFRVNNQNRGSGNTEAIWVAQMEVDVPGGMLESSNMSGNTLERQHVPASWTLQDPNAKPAVLGWRSDANTGGRGVSFMRPTSFFENDLWVSDYDSDIRNSEYNYVRDFFYDDPSSAFFGMSLLENPGPNWLAQSWRWYPWLTKVTTPGKHPENLYENRELGLLSSSGGSTYTDQYYLRLAETYLLRAEAYLAKGELEAAAEDINMVRNRANATPVDAADVDIDYILDERARELSFEENRRITLQRLGKLVERVRLYNNHNGDEIQDYHEVWPIPFSEIEANTGGDLGQNPGY